MFDFVKSGFLILNESKEVMKTYKKNKFHFLHNDGTKKLPKNGDHFFRFEWKFRMKFPFLHKRIVMYTLMNDIWTKRK